MNTRWRLKLRISSQPYKVYKGLLYIVSKLIVNSMSHTEQLSDIGLIGLAVMGENLALNMERNGFQVSVYNRAEGAEANVVSNFISGRGAGKRFQGYTDLAQFVQSLERPRKIMMMIRAGKPVDLVIEGLLPYLEAGDIVIDGGNSNWEDSERREATLRQRGIYFVGAGISGGEEGALNGPAIMPGGAVEAWPHIQPIFERIAAKAPEDGLPCCSWVGGGGSGHFVKMVHNGIEYGDMQLIAEAYWVMKHQHGLDNDQMGQIFEEWNRGQLSSYLIEISAQILKHREASGTHLIDSILDTAGQKGTGKWSVINSLEYGTPLNLIASAVYERSLSSNKALRLKASETFAQTVSTKATATSIEDLRQSLYASKLVSYAQGFVLMQQASRERGWGLDLASVAKLWRAGCIIRSSFLAQISEAYERNTELEHLLLDEYFAAEIRTALPSWKQVVAESLISEVPVPAFSSSLNYFLSLRSRELPANMIQAQRDFFGAHTFERKDAPRGQFFHEDWTGRGGKTASTTYNI